MMNNLYKISSLSLFTLLVMTLQGCNNSDDQHRQESKTFEQRCSELTGKTVGVAKITKTELVKTDAIPEWKACQLRAEVTYSQSKLEMLIELPPENLWNQDLLQLGGGGFNGSIAIPPDNLRKLGFVISASDSGHQGNGLDFSFASDQTALDNFAFGSHPIVLASTKDAIKLMYTSPLNKKYFYGASTGGREALLQAQRYPENYDGIIAGMPVVDYSMVIQRGIQVAQAIFPNNAKGWMSQEKLKHYETAQLEACDANDGLKDGLISNYSACHWNPVVLRCASGEDEADTCLSDAQLKTVNLLTTRAELPFALSNQITSVPAFGMGAESTQWASHQFGTSNTAINSGLGVFSDSYFKYGIAKNKDADMLTYNFDQFGENWLKLSTKVNATNPDLSAFFRNGGKLILWHGLADGLVPPGFTIDYYNAVVNLLGKDAVNNSVKFYTSPGLGHAFIDADLVPAMKNWVENTNRPEVIVENKQIGDITVTRPLCEWPKWAKYNGSGDQKNYTSFTCVNS